MALESAKGPLSATIRPVGAVFGSAAVAAGRRVSLPEVSEHGDRAEHSGAPFVADVRRA